MDLCAHFLVSLLCDRRGDGGYLRG